MRFAELPSSVHAGASALERLLHRVRKGQGTFTHSLRTKLTAMTLAAILISVLSTGVISILSIKRAGDMESLERLTLLCDNRRRKLNEYLDSIEQSVDMISRYAGEDLRSVELMDGGVIGATGYGDNPLLKNRTAEQRTRLDAYLTDHAARVEAVFRSVSNHTNGVLTYYYRLNPELSDAVKGFWYSRKGMAQFVSLEPTDILNFSPDDRDHAGFYYIPLSRSRPSWLEPYYNANLDTVIISYAIPIYKAGTFVGIVGMDISYQTLVDQISSIRVYNTGYVFLADETGAVYYHPTLAPGTSLEAAESSLTDLTQWLRNDSSADAGLATGGAAGSRRYTYDGVERMMVFHTLSNGMKLIVTAPVREINANWLKLVNRICVTAAVILLIFAGAMFFLMNRVTEPLLRLTNASRLLAEGNYDVDLDYHGNDEVGILTGAFLHLVNHLRVYISDLNSRAYMDAMTGVKNKGAYNITVKQLNDAIRLAGQDQGTPPQFAIIMLDCNNLKKINDQYGHEKGDAYLKTACSLVCRIFTHSPVFRLGGDEFGVILQNDDYDARFALLDTFAAAAADINARASAPWEEINIAKGMAVYDSLTDFDVENVMHRADELMYLDKQRMKKGQVR